MNLYNKTAIETAEMVTKKYSTSFSMASRLFPPKLRAHIYNIYALVRVADEIVDTYKGKEARKLTDELEQSVYDAIKRGYSPDLVVHAFQLTANMHKIDKSLIRPFFDSMRMDLTKQKYDSQKYKQYIHGSAEVVGLMCLKVFTHEARTYKKLKPGAEALGSAFQKVNFLRDLKADHDVLGRFYFPDYKYENFDEAAKLEAVSDIRSEMDIAKQAIKQLPSSSRYAVKAAYRYYRMLLNKLERTPVDELKTKRVRVSNAMKIVAFVYYLFVAEIRRTFRG